MNKMLSILSTVFILSIINAPAMADDDDNGKDECIVGQVNGLSLTDEFGAAVPDITRCLSKTNKIKLVMQVNKACRDTTIVSTNTGYRLDNHANTCGASRGYGIAQMTSMIKDWKITHDIPADKLELVMVVHGGGGSMMMNNPANKLKPVVLALLADDVKIQFCMNTVRGMARKVNKTPAQIVKGVIPGVTYVTGGLTALSDYQSKGYTYIHP